MQPGSSEKGLSVNGKQVDSPAISDTLADLGLATVDRFLLMLIQCVA